MAEKKKASPLSIAVPNLPLRETSETEEARRRYEEALQNVLATVEKRKNRLIEPTWAAISRGLANPSRFAEEVEGARRETQAEDELLAQQKLALAQAQLEMSGQKARMGRVRERFGISPEVPQAPGAPAPSMPAVTGAPAPGAPVPAALAPAFKPDPSGLPGAMSFEEFAEIAMDNGIFDEMEIRDRWSKYSEKMRTTTGGTTRIPGAKPLMDMTARVERQIPELGGTFSVSLSDSMELDESRGDPARRAAIVDKIAGRPSRPATPAAAPPATPAAPLGAPTPMSKEELAAKAAGEQEFAGTTAKKAAELESTLPDKYQQALMMSNIAREISTKVMQSPQAVGVLRQPGPASALGRLIQEGIKAGNTSISLGGFEDAIRQVNPNIKQADLDNLMMVAGNLAELELIYTNLYLRGGGQITEGEREIVRRVVGSPALSPKFLIVKAELLKTRSDQDIALYNAYQKAKENNPRIRYADWLNQNEARGILNQFDKRFKSLMGLVPGGRTAPSSAPKAPSPRGGPEGVEVPDSIPKGTKIERRPL